MLPKSLLGPKPYKFIGFGDIHGPKPYKFIGFGPNRPPPSQCSAGPRATGACPNGPLWSAKSLCPPLDVCFRGRHTYEDISWVIGWVIRPPGRHTYEDISWVIGWVIRPSVGL